jgi:hypothetical protein
LLLFFSYFSTRIQFAARKYYSCGCIIKHPVDDIGSSFRYSPLLQLLARLQISGLWYEAPIKKEYSSPCWPTRLLCHNQNTYSVPNALPALAYKVKSIIVGTQKRATYTTQLKMPRTPAFPVSSIIRPQIPVYYKFNHKVLLTVFSLVDTEQWDNEF